MASRSVRVVLSSILIVASAASSARARPFRVAQVPNGAVAQCLTCHVYPGGPRNAFGEAIESYGDVGFLDGPGGNVQWGTVAIADPAHPLDPPKTLGELDSDGDGRTNGEELLDPHDVWRVGQPNPGEPASVRLPGEHDAAVVIRQLFAGGGAPGAPYQHDFIELFNRSAFPVSLAGWSLQTAPATGAGNFGATEATRTLLPDVVLMPGQSFLVQGAQGAGSGAGLPSPDLVDATPLALSETGGKVALVTTTAALDCNGNPTSCSLQTRALFVDRVGYGNANYYEGLSPAPALSPTSAAARTRMGCTDINSNGSAFPPVVGDFTASAPTPRTSTDPFTPCGPIVEPPPPAPVPIGPRWLLALLAGLLLTLGARGPTSVRTRGDS